MSGHRRLDQILQSKGQVSERQIREALIKQSVLGGQLGEHLIRRGGVGEAELVDALSEQYGLPGICLERREVETELFARIPFVVAEQHRCVPFAYDAKGDTLEVAFANPHDRAALHAVSAAAHPTKIKPYVAAAVHVRQALAAHRRKGRPDSSGSESTGRLDGVLDLLELALGSGQDNLAQRKVSSAWVARLAVDIANRLFVKADDLRKLRLAALVSDMADWRRSSPNRPRPETIGQSIAVLRDLDLPWDIVSFLQACAQKQSPNKTVDVLESILRVAWAAADTMPQGDDDAMLDQWHDRLSDACGSGVDVNVIKTAFVELRVRSLRRRLGDHPPEIVVIGRGSFAEELLGTLRETHYRVANAQYWAEGVVLLERRCPDLVCVVASGLSIPPLHVMEGQMAEHGINPSSVILVVPQEDGDRPYRAGPGEGAMVMAETSGVTGVVGRMRALLQRLDVAMKSPGASRRGGPPDPAVVGRLADLGLPDLVQVLSSGHKTAHVALTSSLGEGSLWFDRGQIAAARSHRLSGEEAFFDLLHWSEGRFAVHTVEHVPERNITTQTTALLLEGFRRMDESKRAVNS